jgi:hypothetical protein
MQQQIQSLKLSTSDNLVRLRCPVDPPVYKTDAIYTRVIQFSITAASTITYADLYTALGITSGSADDFSLAVTSVRLWGPAAADSFLQVDVVESSLGGTPTFVRFEDYGTQGARRSGIAVQFPKLIREQWAPSPTNATTLLHVVSSIPTVLQFSVRLRLNGAT